MFEKNLEEDDGGLSEDAILHSQAKIQLAYNRSKTIVVLMLDHHSVMSFVIHLQPGTAQRQAETLLAVLLHSIDWYTGIQ
jgi:hypothetical protein